MTPERWLRIKGVFQTAAELSPGDCDAYLAAETGDDPELRQQVEKMLRHAAGAGLLDRPAWDGLSMESGLPAGTRLGPYEILEEAGAGGMGLVYKARDTRLGRMVAIKVLRAEFSHRLRTEARAISALNHPHVCALYDIGMEQGSAYLVMEWVEGESLAAHLSQAPLALDEALRYGAEIAGALAAAHAQGIVHRDLKPANIMITASGAKVLDFGVAQIAQDGETPTGVAGTAAYMSPSQLNGNPADARSDIFALGLVLYEMVTRTRPSPESPRQMTNVPAKLAELIGLCTAKDAAVRVQSMEEVRVKLQGLRSQPRAPRLRWEMAGGLAALLATMGTIAFLGWKPSREVMPPAHPPEVERGAVAPPPVGTPPAKAAAPVPAAPRIAPPPPSLVTLASYPGLERDPSFSPDGTKVAFSWHRGRPGYGIYVKPVQEDALPVDLTAGNAEDWGPAWSPDGRRIAFRRKAAESGIYYVPAAGGPASLVASIARQGQETLPQMSWSHDGRWIAAPDRDAGGATQIYLFSVESGERRPLTFDANGTNHAPAFSPDGKSLAYASCDGAVYPCDIYVIALGKDYAPKAQRKITSQGMYLRGLAWLPGGRGLVYAAGPRVSADTSLWRVSLNPPGVPERIDIAGSQARHPAVSMTGRYLAYTRLNHWNLAMIRNFR